MCAVILHPVLAAVVMDVLVFILMDPTQLTNYSLTCFLLMLNIVMRCKALRYLSTTMLYEDSCLKLTISVSQLTAQRAFCACTHTCRTWGDGGWMFVRYQNYIGKLGGGADKRGGNSNSRLRYLYYHTCTCTS